MATGNAAVVRYGPLGPGVEIVFGKSYMRSDARVDFKLKQKGIAFANGVSVRWADWEPMGPYPVVDFAEPPRRW